ncbi:O-methyltransferase [Dyadobacter tibetensis]|uniref:O-methyltransferase n=1 Tax=Dyadobacter tibetensis TaxID=1211851 RepID=UPI00046E9BB7|nr:class I SAM-dependent methyltransferase [Dyadobacter tibetensis]
MRDTDPRLPAAYDKIAEATLANGFNMASDRTTCSLLRTLAATKPNGDFLELGTGTGLSTACILDGMDSQSTLVSIDYDAELLAIASDYLGKDPRLSLIHSDGEIWVKTNRDKKYDYIFADTWHGKYLLLDEVLYMLNPGGLYIVDDMLPQPNWPEGHEQKAHDFTHYLEGRKDLIITKLTWATGIIIAVKR